MLNYEVGVSSGYAQIPGIEAYSGGVVNDVIDPLVIYSGAGGSNVTLSSFLGFTEGVQVTWGSGGQVVDGAISTYDGRAVVSLSYSDTVSEALFGLVAIEGRFPVVGDVITDGGVTATVTAPVTLASSALEAGVTLPSYANTVDRMSQFTADADGYNTIAQDTLKAIPFPGSPKGYAHGGFYWKDRLHVIADLQEFPFTAGSTEPAVGDRLAIYYTGTHPTGSFNSATVEAVITESGSWSGGTAAGRIILAPYQPTNSPNTMLVKAATDCANLTTAVDSPIVLGTRARSTRAALWKDSGPYSQNGWERQDLGHEIRFRSGENFPVVLNRANRDPQLEETVTTTAWLPAGTGTGTGWSSPSNITGASDTVVATFSGNPAESPPIKATNFGFVLPANAVVLGVEMRFTRREDGTFTAKDYEIVLTGISGTSQNKAKFDAWPAALAVSGTYGSISDGWGADLSGTIVNSSGFGVSIRAIRSGGTPEEFEIDSVEMRVTYKDRSSTFYFRDTVAAADVGTGRLIWYYKDKGDWDTNDAEGVMTFYSLSAATAIRDGHQIRTAAAGAGDLVATVGSAAAKVYMPSSAMLDAKRSQFESVIGNFFSAADTEQVFVVSGADFAASWDGRYYIRIRTGVEANADKPRHVGKHGDQLILGYEAGVGMASDLGYPESFSGVTDGSSPISDDGTTYPTFAGGAQELPFGDPCYGFMPLTDQALGVLCRRSIQQIVGGGGALVTSLIEGSSGGIEYTLANIGIPVFMDFRGVGTVQATDAYGNFARGRLSAPVSRWLVPRLQERGAFMTSNRGPVRVEVVRFKNQCRWYFRDRYALTMTMVGNDFSNPQFSIQRLPFVPTFTCSGVTSGGKDVIFCGTYGSADIGSSPNLLAEAYGGVAAYGSAANLYVPSFIYQMDCGHAWDRLLPIERYFVLNGGSVGEEWREKHFDRCVVSGLMYGVTHFGMSWGMDYDDIESDVTNMNPGSASDAGSNVFTERAFAISQDIDRDGFAIAMRFESDSNSLYGGTSAQTSPYKFRPHTIQAVTAFIESNKSSR